MYGKVKWMKIIEREREKCFIKVKVLTVNILSNIINWILDEERKKKEKKPHQTLFIHYGVCMIKFIAEKKSFCWLALKIYLWKKKVN